MTDSIAAILDAALDGQLPSDEQALVLAGEQDTRRLADVAATVRDRGFHNVVT